SVNLSGTNWLTAGNFSTAAHSPAPASTSAVHRSAPRSSPHALAAPISPQAPLLVPDGTPTFNEQNATWLKWDEGSQTLTIANHGPSPAFNVAGVLYGCESYIIQGNRDTSSRNEHWTCWLGKSIPSGSSLTALFEKGNGIFYDDNKSIDGHAFN